MIPIRHLAKVNRIASTMELDATPAPWDAPKGARITITRRSWLSGLLVSHAWATEWADAYRVR